MATLAATTFPWPFGSQPSMRILFLHHAPLEESAVGRLTVRWQTSLANAGHQARVLVVDERQRTPGDTNTERVVCSINDAAADLPFDVPRFSSDRDARLTFGQLSDQQLQQYRDVLRRRLDGQVDRFNPHVLHVQYVSLLGQLAVETGVPYVASVWGPELQPPELDSRVAPLAEQAAANAGRILAPDEATLRLLAERFEFDAERAMIAPAELGMASGESATGDLAAEVLLRLYESLLAERFGSA
jgi:hypothetical protein